MTRPIVFISDYGLGDEFVGVCHGVIERLTPGTRVIDLTHGIPRHDIARAAFTLAQTSRYMPRWSVFLAVVDPGVGSDRRPIGVATADGSTLVGPDNGLLSQAWSALGGVTRAVELTDVSLEPVSMTFHGRDVFAPAAALLAGGAELTQLGRLIDPATLISLEPLVSAATRGRLDTEVLAVDRYGNLQLAAGPAELAGAGLEEEPFLLQVRKASVRLVRAVSFAYLAPGQFGLLVDSAGRLAVVLNRGSAAEALGASAGDSVTLVPYGEMSQPAQRIG